MVLSAILSIITIDVTVGRMCSGIPSTFQSVPQIYSVQFSYFRTFGIQNKTYAFACSLKRQFENESFTHWISQVTLWKWYFFLQSNANDGFKYSRRLKFIYLYQNPCFESTFHPHIQRLESMMLITL